MRILIILFFLLISLDVFPLNYYVSATGSDANNGTSTSTPWQTLAKVNAHTFVAGDNIFFKRGDVFYGKIISSTAGRSGSPVTYSSYGLGSDPNPVITGLQNITGGWTNMGGNIWQSVASVSTLSNLKTVLINGKSTPMGRYPNGDATYPFLPNFYIFQSITGDGSGASSITSNSLSGATDWTGADVVIRISQWAFHKETITSNPGSTINFTGATGGLEAGWGFFIQNDLRTLDQQGEWYYNPSTKKLSIYSAGAPTSVQVSTVDTLFYLYSNIPDVNYTSIDHIDFKGGNTNNIFISGNLSCSVTNCHVSYAGLEGMLLNGGGIIGGTIDSCGFYGNGSSGIFATGSVNNLTITNDSVNVSGIISVYKQNDFTNGGINCNAPGSLMQYNNIDSSAYCGINFKGSNIEARNNFINHSALVRADAGGIYTGFASETGKVIDGNIILNSVGNPRGSKSNDYFAMGIYSDDLGTGIQITNNTIANAHTSGIYVHNSNNLTITNNTIFNCGSIAGEQMWANGGMSIDGNGGSFANSIFGNTSKNNIIVATNNYQYALNYYFEAGSGNDPQNFGLLDSNYYARPINDNLTIEASQTFKTLPMWVTFSGQDVHSKKSPLMVMDPSQVQFYYNFTKSDSTVSVITGIDLTGASYSGTTVLHPFTSLVLLATAALITPTITWADPSAITYGTALSSTQLNASTGVAGTFSYNYASGTVLNAGTYTLTVVFTPTDGATYSTATKSVSLTVNPQVVSLSFSNLTQTYTGAPLSPILTATPPASTAFTIDGITGGRIDAGTYALLGAVTDANHTATPITGTFTINKATATINANDQTFNYDGLPHSIAYTTTPIGLNVVQYFSSGSAPSAIGVYTDTLRMVESNHSATQVVKTITIVSNPAIIFISDTAKVYNGSPQAVTVTSSYSHAETYNGSATIPTDAGTYEVVTHITDGIHTGADTANLTISQKPAILSWLQPANAPYGTLFGTQQLNATADVTGTHVYNYNIGQIIPLGTTVLTDTFTPTSANYVGSTITTSITTFTEDQLIKFYLTNNLFIKQ